MQLNVPAGQGVPQELLSTEIFTVGLIQLFVSCFCPVIDKLRQVDLLNLAPGVGLWGKLMDHEQPDVDCFSLFVKMPVTSKNFDLM